MAHAAPQLDHLVVAAATLAQGVQWCEDVLGVTIGPGGEHPLMGTHNRLGLLSSDGFARCYLEVIAIAPDMVPQKNALQARWFDLDNPQRLRRLHDQGPELLHWVARVPQLEAALATCEAHHVHAGVATRASRPTPQGLLEWNIAIPVDGCPAANNMWPTLISWGDYHPTQSMPSSGLALQNLHVAHPLAAELNALWRNLGADHDRFILGPPSLSATLMTPRGEVTLKSAA